MVKNAKEEYITYERFHTLNKQCTSESCVLDASGSNLFYDLDSVVKRNSYSCCTEDIALSTVNIFRALNRRGDEWPKAPSQANPVHIVQECTTSIKPNLNRRDNGEKLVKKERSAFLRECVLSSGICLKDNIEDSDSSSNPNPSDKDNTTISRVKNCVSYQTEHIRFEGHDKNKTMPEKRVKNVCPCEYDSLGCACKAGDKAFKTETSKFVDKPRIASSYREEVVSNMSNNHRTHLEMEDKLTRMSGDGLTETHSLYIPKKDTSCILILGQSDIPKNSHSQVSSFRKSGVRLMKVVTKRNRAKSKKVRAVKCPNCREHIEFTVSTEDDASSGVPPKKNGKSETVFNCTVSSKERINPKIAISKECPHGCEMVPICQILPKVNINDSNIRRSVSKKTMPQFIKMTKPCRHYPPCSVVPTCQRNNVMKVNCESISPCYHRPRCLNLPLCIPFCKNLQYDESTKHYVDIDDQLKYVPVSQLQTHSLEPRAHLVNQTHLSCQVTPPNAKQYDIANKSCQYNHLQQKSNNAAKEDTTDASVIYIRDVGCQFKNSSFTPHTSYFQTRVCYTSSASFDPGSKRLDNIYTNPKAFTCETLIINAKSKINSKPPSTSRLLSSGVDSLSSKHDSTHKEVSKAHPESEANTVAFCMLRNGEGGYLFPQKPKRSAFKDKCKNKFTISRRQISKVSNSWFRKNV